MSVFASPHSDSGSFRAEIRRHDAATILSFTGDLDLASSERARNALFEAFDGAVEQLVLDFTGITFMDSTGVHIALEAEACSAARGVRLAIVHGPRHAQRLFELCDLTERLLFVSPSYAS